LQLRAARTLEQAVPWGMLAGQGGQALPRRDPRPLRDGRVHDVRDEPSRGRGARAGSTSGSPLSSCSRSRARFIAERTAKKLEAALHANGPGPLGPECRRLALHPGLWVTEFSNLGLVFGVVWAMTEKPGLGGSLAAVLVGYGVGAVLAVLASRAPQEERPAATELAG